MKNILSSTLALSLLSVCISAASDPLVLKTQDKAPKNIIMVIGDGMGPSYTSAYRYYADDPATDAIEQTVFDRHLVANSTTYPARVSGYITDSAAAATALATGFKTYNDAISVDVNGKPLETVLEKAKLLGKKTGVVVTSQINHATPASYLSHNAYRRNYNEIADSYLDNGIKADVYLGGGWQYFIRDKRNLVSEFTAQGFHYVDQYQQLNDSPLDKPLIGLFGDQGLPWALDDTDKHRLLTMTKAALPRLENEQGYFMLIEASLIDWAGHANDIAAAMYEMDDLAKTLEYLEKYVAKNPDTMVIVTADHSTGGLSIGRKTAKSDPNVNSKYLWQPEIIRQMSISPEAFSKLYATTELSHQDINNRLNFVLSDKEFNQLATAKAQAIIALNQYEQTPEEQRTSKYAPQVNRAITESLKDIIDIKTNTGWGGISSSATHTAVDVPVFVISAEQSPFKGVIDNTDIAKTIFKLLEK